MITKFPVLVEWEDSAQPVAGWCFIKDAPSLEVVDCKSVGWVIGENKKVIMLAPNIGRIKSDEAEQASGVIRIPKSAITKLTALTKVLPDDKSTGGH